MTAHPQTERQALDAAISTVAFVGNHNARVYGDLYSPANERVLDVLDAQKQQAYAELRDEFLQQFFRTGHKGSVRTPGYAQSTFTVAEVVNDFLAGTTGDEDGNTMLDIIARAAAGGDAQALAWVQKVAHAHADFHSEDLVSLRNGDTE